MYGYRARIGYTSPPAATEVFPYEFYLVAPKGVSLAISTLAIVGPEAGFTDAECQRMKDGGAAAVRLSAQRLRAETAALAMISIVAAGRPAV
jgi:RsmE family RNA methyltransferase